MTSYDRGLSWHVIGIRCYFPEWADRPADDGAPRESDRNSYLAGGYAEEFGYHAQRRGRPALATLKGDPERSSQWRVQIGGLHPGYPECPRPLDRDAVQRGAFGAGDAQSAARLARSESAYHAGETLHRVPVSFTVIRVGEQGRTGRQHVRGPVALTLLWRAFRIRRRELGRLF